MGDQAKHSLALLAADARITFHSTALLRLKDSTKWAQCERSPVITGGNQRRDDSCNFGRMSGVLSAEGGKVYLPNFTKASVGAGDGWGAIKQ